MVLFILTQRESIVRLMTVSKKNTTSPSDQATPCDAAADEPVSLVLVSARGRVAVYDTSLKLAASFTLALSCASVAGASSPAGVEDAAGGTSAAQPAGSTPATKSLYKGLVAQKVFDAFIQQTKKNFSVALYRGMIKAHFFFFREKLENYKAHSCHFSSWLSRVG